MLSGVRIDIRGVYEVSIEQSEKCIYLRFVTRTPNQHTKQGKTID